MQSWFSKSFDNGAVAQAPSVAMINAYLAYAVTHGEDTGAAIFSRLDLKTGVVTAYFTPEASELAKQFEATPCDKPLRDRHLGLLTGSALDWAKHFPN